MAHALDHRIEHGIWGGMTERERRSRPGATPSAVGGTGAGRLGRGRPRGRWPGQEECRTFQEPVPWSRSA
ncbi:WhiB family transcriptional regulator [Streptomyces sp. NPDC048664]|uniref:WhiB family transcriptional regulator n=1 Tax=Streptomyces sp. NPDC048664 TaxID=3154505 RepID=UPI003416172D